MITLSDLSFRDAGPADAAGVAELHADSWRRFYRGAYADAYLDGDVVADRRTVWSGRLAAPNGTPHADRVTIVAEAGGELAGFVHLALDRDDRWGWLLDNLHVRQAHQRHGIGSALLRRSARAVLDHGAARALYLWVLEQNTNARAFYAAHGGRFAEREPLEPPGGVPGRINDGVAKLRCVWPDAGTLA